MKTIDMIVGTAATALLIAGFLVNIAHSKRTRPRRSAPRSAQGGHMEDRDA